MNERIQELALQADLIRYPSDGINTKIVKFAQLIIEKCANVADENYIHRGSRTCGLAIRLHFGVEE
jgi:hypothetical protein